MQRTLSHNERENIAALRTECHADADFPRAARDRIRFHAVNADDCEQQGDSAEDTEESGAKSHDPKADTFFHHIAERRDAEHRQVGIDVAKHLTHRWNQSDDGAAIFRGETNVQENISAVTMRERHKQPAIERVVLHVMPVLANDAHDFQVIRRTVAR